MYGIIRKTKSMKIVSIEGVCDYEQDAYEYAEEYREKEKDFLFDVIWVTKLP